MKIFAIAFLASIVPALANAGVQFSSPNVASGVTDLVVGTKIYDVNFDGTENGFFWSNNLDFTDKSSATDASVALADILNSADVTSVLFDLPGGTTFEATSSLSIPYEISGLNLLTVGPFFNSGQWLQTLGGNVPINNNFPFIVDFKQTGVVPLPAALPLMVSGLAGLAWLARRRAVG